MPRIVWTEEAIQHLEAIVTYVSVHDPAAAERLALRLIELADSLAEFRTVAVTQGTENGR